MSEKSTAKIYKLLDDFWGRNLNEKNDEKSGMGREKLVQCEGRKEMLFIESGYFFVLN